VSTSLAPGGGRLGAFLAAFVAPALCACASAGTAHGPRSGGAGPSASAAPQPEAARVDRFARVEDEVLGWLSAADPRLLTHEGQAIVFEDVGELAARVNDPDIEVDADSVMVLRNAGPVGGPGMPEWGQLPIPQKLLRQGVSDLLRISDARMSGTSYGAVVLHVAPESAVGGPLALVRTGDRVRIDVEARTLDMLVDQAELDRRRAAWTPPATEERGYRRLYLDHVLQANEGCDLDFLRGHSAVVTTPTTYL